MSISVHPTESVQDYVAGRMSDAERQAFEGRLLTDSELLQDLETSLRLREGLAMLREQKALERPQFPRHRALRAGLAWASAAALAAIIVWVTLYNVRRSPPIVGASVAALSAGLTRAPPVVERYTFAATRAPARTPDLGLPSSGALELRVFTAITDASETFRVTLDLIQKQKTSRIGGQEHMLPDADGFVVIYADASRLEPGEYLLRVERDGALDPSTTARFAFLLDRSAGGPSLLTP
jgi:hypothetical protein